MRTKNILIGLTIFSAGVGTGYFISLKRLKAQYKEDLGEVKQFYMNKLEEMGIMDSDFDPEDLNEDDEDDEDDEEEIKEYYDRVMKYSSVATSEERGKGRPIIKYNKPPLIQQDWGTLEGDEGEGDIEEDYEDDEDDEDDPMDLAYEAELEARAEEFAKRKDENKSNGLPYVIDYNEWEYGPDEYDRQFLYYYSEDRVLCEDDDSIVEDEEELVGYDYEDVLEMQTTAWVRNDKILVLYEIHRIDDSYSRSVANIAETPRERDYRIKGRRKQALDD